MMEGRDYMDYLRDILDGIEKAESFIGGMDFEQFVSDEKTAFAVVRALEIIGEAVKKVPTGLRETNPDLPWREMAGLRDKLIHDYISVNLEVVWKTVKNDLPPLHGKVAAILSAELGD